MAIDYAPGRGTMGRMLLHRLVRWTMIGSLGLAIAGWWMKDVLPPPGRLAPDVANEPVQKPARGARPFEVAVNGITYRVQPRYAYDLSALVVSLHHSDTWWDTAHKEWGDHVNVMDLCVVWGSSATSGAYKSVRFHNSQWECHWSWRGEVPFRNDEASNNHVVTEKPEVAKALKSIRIGDQVRIKGWLVDYTIVKDGRPQGTRVSSERRNDDGPGACEVIYVDEVEVLGQSGRRWALAMKTGLGLLLASLFAWLLLPARFDD